jgi:hypothetical protein
VINIALPAGPTVTMLGDPAFKRLERFRGAQFRKCFVGERERIFAEKDARDYFAGICSSASLTSESGLVKIRENAVAKGLGRANNSKF